MIVLRVARVPIIFTRPWVGDTLNGGAGTNTLDFSNGSGGLTINLTTLTETGWGTDTFSNFQ